MRDACICVVSADRNTLPPPLLCAVRSIVRPRIRAVRLDESVEVRAGVRACVCLRLSARVCVCDATGYPSMVVVVVVSLVADGRLVVLGGDDGVVRLVGSVCRLFLHMRVHA